jgi:hypothetical protein
MAKRLSEYTDHEWNNASDEERAAAMRDLAADLEMARQRIVAGEDEAATKYASLTQAINEAHQAAARFNQAAAQKGSKTSS